MLLLLSDITGEIILQPNGFLFFSKLLFLVTLPLFDSFNHYSWDKYLVQINVLMNSLAYITTDFFFSFLSLTFLKCVCWNQANHSYYHYIFLLLKDSTLLCWIFYSMCFFYSMFFFKSTFFFLSQCLLAVCATGKMVKTTIKKKPFCIINESSIVWALCSDLVLMLPS